MSKCVGQTDALRRHQKSRYVILDDCEMTFLDV